jgi:TPP-dependent trihydroxycyclohexane-1,2-dione (THcHDO) dehydratase
MDNLDANKLYAALDPKQVNSLASGFRGAMSPQVKSGYANMSPAERREWLAQYVLDPETGVNHGFSETKSVNSRKNRETTEWLTEAELGGPKWLNAPHHASILVKSGSLPSRLHEIQALADEKVYQYEYSKQQVGC